MVLKSGLNAIDQSAALTILEAAVCQLVTALFLMTWGIRLGKLKPCLVQSQRLELPKWLVFGAIRNSFEPTDQTN